MGDLGLKEKVRKLVAKGYLDTAIEYFQKNATIKPYCNGIIPLAARLSELKRKQFNDKITSEEADLVKNEIQDHFLTLVDDYPDDPPKPILRKWFLLILALIVIAGAVFVIPPLLDPSESSNKENTTLTGGNTDPKDSIGANKPVEDLSEDHPLEKPKLKSALKTGDNIPHTQNSNAIDTADIPLVVEPDTKEKVQEFAVFFLISDNSDQSPLDQVRVSSGSGNSGTSDLYGKTEISIEGNSKGNSILFTFSKEGFSTKRTYLTLHPGKAYDIRLDKN